MRRKSLESEGGGVTSTRVITALLGNLFPPLAAIASAPILAQSLGLPGRGDVAAATAPFLLLTAVATFGIPEAAAYAVAVSPRLTKKVLSRSRVLLFFAGIGATVAAMASASAVASGDEGISLLIVIASLAIMPSLVVGAYRGVASGLHEWGLVTRERAIGSILRVIFLVPLWLAGSLTPLLAVLVLVLTPALGGLSYARLTTAASDGHPSASRAEDVSSRALLYYGARVWAGSISGVILTRIDQVLVAPLSSAESLGLYVVAVSISELPLVINSAVRDVTFVSEAAGSDSARLCASARLSTLICGMAALAIGSTAYLWLAPVFGSEFYSAIPILHVLLVAVVAGTPGSIAGSLLGGRGRPGLRSWSLAAASLVNVGLIVLLVPRIGALGAAFATLVGNAIASNMNILFARRFFGIRMRDFYMLRRNDIRILQQALSLVARRLSRRPTREDAP